MPVLAFDPVGCDFGSLIIGETDATSFDVWNGGTGTLSFTVSESVDWLSVSPGGGSSSGVGDVVSIDVVVDTSGLSVGGYHCDVVLDGGSGGSGVFGVDVSVIEGGGEVLDVAQEAGGYSFAVFDGRWAAQSFVPGLGSVCRLELSLSKRGSPGGDVTVSYTHLTLPTN